MTVLAAIEPQRPCQSNATGVTGLVVLDSADGAVVGSVLVSAGEIAAAPVAPVPVSKPEAHTAPVARPTAPNASQAASRPREDLRTGDEGMLDTSSFPFVTRATPVEVEWF